jgi:hypothetical protein
MAKVCQTPLKANPFQTYRDPKTGEWIVIKPPPRDRATKSA